MGLDLAKNPHLVSKTKIFVNKYSLYKMQYKLKLAQLCFFKDIKNTGSKNV